MDSEEVRVDWEKEKVSWEEAEVDVDWEEEMVDWKLVEVEVEGVNCEEAD